jgi:hypothetical protein
MAQKKRGKKDLDPKAKGKNVRGGINVWQDSKDKLPLKSGKLADDLVIKPVQNAGKRGVKNPF